MNHLVSHDWLVAHDAGPQPAVLVPAPPSIGSAPASSTGIETFARYARSYILEPLSYSGIKRNLCTPANRRLAVTDAAPAFAPEIADARMLTVYDGSWARYASLPDATKTPRAAAILASRIEA